MLGFLEDLLHRRNLHQFSGNIGEESFATFVDLGHDTMAVLTRQDGNRADGQ